METIIFIQDTYRVVYRIGEFVYKKRAVGLDHEYVVGQYMNTQHNPHYVFTEEYVSSGAGGRLATRYVEGKSWYEVMKQQETYEACRALNLSLLNALAVLPITHYDLHMNNVIVTSAPNAFRFIDYGFSALPPEQWQPTPRYSEASAAALTCGIYPAVFDPGYDRMLFLLALYKQATLFRHAELLSYCAEAIAVARFDHPRFYGYEHLLTAEFIQNYRNLFYTDRMPLLAPSNLRINYSNLVLGMEKLKVLAVRWLQKEHKLTEGQALAFVTNPERNYLNKWVRLHEREVYGLLYAYKRHRIATRVLPSFEAIRAMV